MLAVSAKRPCRLWARNPDAGIDVCRRRAVPQSSAFTPASTTPFGKAFADPKALQDPISSLEEQQAQTAAQSALSSYQSAQGNAEATFQKIVKLTPKDPNAQYQLASVATTIDRPRPYRCSI